MSSSAGTITTAAARRRRQQQQQQQALGPLMRSLYRSLKRRRRLRRPSTPCHDDDADDEESPLLLPPSCVSSTTTTTTTAQKQESMQWTPSSSTILQSAGDPSASALPTGQLGDSGDMDDDWLDPPYLVNMVDRVLRGVHQCSSDVHILINTTLQSNNAIPPVVVSPCEVEKSANASAEGSLQRPDHFRKVPDIDRCIPEYVPTPPLTAPTSPSKVVPVLVPNHMPDSPKDAPAIPPSTIPTATTTTQRPLPPPPTRRRILQLKPAWFLNNAQHLGLDIPQNEQLTNWINAIRNSDSSRPLDAPPPENPRDRVVGPQPTDAEKSAIAARLNIQLAQVTFWVNAVHTFEIRTLEKLNAPKEASPGSLIADDGARDVKRDDPVPSSTNAATAGTGNNSTATTAAPHPRVPGITTGQSAMLANWFASFTALNDGRMPTPADASEIARSLGLVVLQVESWLGKKMRMSCAAPSRISDESRAVLEAWFVENRSCPYISTQTKAELALKSGLSEKQVGVWFNNKRARFVKTHGNAAWYTHDAHTGEIVLPKQAKSKRIVNCESEDNMGGSINGDIEALIAAAAASKSSIPHNNTTTKKRKTMTNSVAVEVLMKWLDENRDDPYPSEITKTQLCSETGMSKKQLSTWFVNGRRRYMSGLLDVT